MTQRVHHHLKPPQIGWFIVFFTDGTHALLAGTDVDQIINRLQHSAFGGRTWKKIYPWKPEEYEVIFDGAPING